MQLKKALTLQWGTIHTKNDDKSLCRDYEISIVFHTQYTSKTLTEDEKKKTNYN